ncbi:MAG: chromosomal replication initiator protein DnaA [Planctomycetota bacterium]|nr:MAG: chromosomal replication initiator protein DnaA [Planctomycetota bacterium]
MAFSQSEWQQVLDRISQDLDMNQDTTWLENLKVLNSQGETIVLATPDAFTKRRVARDYLAQITRYIEEIMGGKVQVELAINKEGSNGTDSLQPPKAAPKKTKQKLPTIPLNPLYTFENFIVGKNNHYCYAMAKAVSEKPGTLYNPLFIHGAVGLGKTHLLQAICHHLLSEREDLSILYLSSDNFIEQLIDAIQQGGLSRFRYKYRYIDVLVIDDIHYLANKEQTQEEFFHIFNNLYTSQKQIILSSDSPPKEIPSMQERLVSRFKWGVVAQIEPPPYETRMAIVRKKAMLRDKVFPNEVVEFIAKNFSRNIRELEGAVWKLESYSSLIGEEITLDLAKEVLQDLLHTSRVKISMGEIQEEVTKTFQVKLSDLQSKKRSQSITLPRQVCMYLAREYTDLSLEEIGDYFGGRDHSTVAHSIDKIANHLLPKDAKLKALVNQIIENLHKKSRMST